MVSWDVAGGTVQGTRPSNQDRFFASPDVIAVFDGVGGHPHGEAAAEAAAGACLQDAGFDSVQRAVLATGGMTTGAVVHLGREPSAWSVGDSRIFTATGTGWLTPSDGADPGLLQALGQQAVTPHEAPCPTQSLAVFTDGVERLVSRQELAAAMHAGAAAAVATILDLVVERGGTDNATVVVAIPIP